MMMMIKQSNMIEEVWGQGLGWGQPAKGRPTGTGCQVGKVLRSEKEPVKQLTGTLFGWLHACIRHYI